MTIASVKAHFAALPPRERRALVVLGVFLFFAGLLQLIWSAVDSSQDLLNKFPELERRVTKAKAIERRVAELRAKAAPVQLEGEALRARCLQIATTRLPGLSTGAIISDGSRGIAFDAVVPFAAWVEFAATLQAELTLRLLSAEVSPSDPGRAQVKARFVLADATP